MQESSLSKPPLTEKTFQEKIEVFLNASASLKSEANALFQQKDYAGARDKYFEAVNHMKVSSHQQYFLIKYQ